MTVTLRPTTQAMRAAAGVELARYYQAQRPEDQLVADPVRRRLVRFDSDGLQLAGHIYRPPEASEAEPTPAIVMCGPYSSVKEQTLPHYAERFADAGHTVLTFDPRSSATAKENRAGTTCPSTSSPTTPTRWATW